jgi:hypothetical protein
MARDATTDVDGLLIRRLRRAPAISNENDRVFYASFEVDMEPGLGLDRPKRARFSMTGVSPV